MDRAKEKLAAEKRRLNIYGQVFLVPVLLVLVQVPLLRPRRLPRTFTSDRRSSYLCASDIYLARELCGGGGVVIRKIRQLVFGCGLGKFSEYPHDRFRNNIIIITDVLYQEQVI